MYLKWRKRIVKFTFIKIIKWIIVWFNEWSIKKVDKITYYFNGFQKGMDEVDGGLIKCNFEARKYFNKFWKI